MSVIKGQLGSLSNKIGSLSGKLELSLSLALTEVEDAISQEGSKSQVEGMACLLLFGKAANFCASKVPDIWHDECTSAGNCARGKEKYLHLSDAL